MISSIEAEFAQLLVRKGLIAIGSEISIRDLAREYGVGRWYDFWDVIYLPRAPLFDENTGPYFIQNDISPLLPPTTFHCDFDCLGDGRRNHELALARLTEVLRHPPQDTSVSNTWSNTWTFGEMSLNIRTFRQSKTSGYNSFYQRYPELWHNCRITIERGWVHPLSSGERALLTSISASNSLPFPVAWAQAGLGTLLDRGLFRRAPGRPDPILWRDPESGQIGWHAGHFAAFVRGAASISLKLAQVEAYRGGGYSRLSLELHNPFSDGKQSAEIHVIRGEDTHTLDAIAAELSAFWALPLQTAAYLSD